MPIDPFQPRPQNADEDRAQRLADLERDRRRQARTPRVQHGDGPPGATAREPYVDDTNARLYFRVGGVWRYAALT